MLTVSLLTFFQLFPNSYNPHLSLVHLRNLERLPLLENVLSGSLPSSRLAHPTHVHTHMLSSRYCVPLHLRTNSLLILNNMQSVIGKAHAGKSGCAHVCGFV